MPKDKYVERFREFEEGKQNTMTRVSAYQGKICGVILRKIGGS